jgi:hypothetical protein
MQVLFTTQERLMKALTLCAAALAIPAGIVLAQTTPAPTPAPTTTTSGNPPYIALFSSGGGGTSGTSGAGATWFIDTANKLVVMCSQGASGSTGGSGTGQSITCTAQAVPSAASGGMPTATGGPAGSAPASAMANPFQN